ncbi:hypothetical protein QTP70_006005 [Hemibagrus guttatus]|uniref:Reverse transcriptase domain-containing protein n=1 Tax=Hemibagrus guttatus TaxID=175788 RepID=A0AAE0Q7J1_9TELE|nr:hypothetical protein QTP70_006005 [Hemibagrus guttatus]KAK3540930.1 hypothetical protein QTP86_005809 [Hemibagrus guttatus]
MFTVTYAAHTAAAPCPHFGQSDHIALFLYPAYRPRLKQTNLDRFWIVGQMWQGLQHITDYRTTTSTTISPSDSLPDDLNIFYAYFETSSDNTERRHTHTHMDHPTPLLPCGTVVHKALRKINPRKAAGPDNIPGWATELDDVLTSIFNLSLGQSTVPTCFKTTTIIPLPKKSPPTCLYDYRPVALTPIIMKYFERVVLAHIQSSIPDTLDPLAYAYQPNRSTSDTIAATLHISLSHLEDKDTYIRALFIDYSSAFNTFLPPKFTHKLFALGPHRTLCDWLLGFLTGRPQSVRIGKEPQPPSQQTLAPNRGVFSVPSCKHCSHMTVSRPTRTTSS